MESFARHGELGLVEEKWVKEYSRGGRREKKRGGM